MHEKQTHVIKFALDRQGKFENYRPAYVSIEARVNLI
jgi:hypothetical protein